MGGLMTSEPPPPRSREVLLMVLGASFEAKDTRGVVESECASEGGRESVGEVMARVPPFRFQWVIPMPEVVPLVETMELAGWEMVTLPLMMRG